MWVMHMPKPIAFFDTQFQRQVRESDFALNPFEQLALDYIAGTVLDYGCGFGNLSIAAARRDAEVTEPAAIVEHGSGDVVERQLLERVQREVGFPDLALELRVEEGNRFWHVHYPHLKSYSSRIVFSLRCIKLAAPGCRFPVLGLPSRCDHRLPGGGLHESTARQTGSRHTRHGAGPVRGTGGSI